MKKEKPPEMGEPVAFKRVGKIDQWQKEKNLPLKYICYEFKPSCCFLTIKAKAAPLMLSCSAFVLASNSSGVIAAKSSSV